MMKLTEKCQTGTAQLSNEMHFLLYLSYVRVLFFVFLFFLVSTEYQNSIWMR